MQHLKNSFLTFVLDGPTSSRVEWWWEGVWGKGQSSNWNLTDQDKEFEIYSTLKIKSSRFILTQ